METMDLKGEGLSNNTVSYLLGVLKRDSEVHIINAFRITPITPKRKELSLRLTTKEALIVSCLMKGHSNRTIGALVGCGDQVVKNHLRRVYTKFRVESRLDLMSHFYSNNLLELLPPVPIL